MKKIYTLSLALLSFTFGAVAQIADGSFEGGVGGGAWTEASTNFGTPICDAGGCGTCGGPCVSNTGTFYCWFGGAGGATETASVEQAVVVPTGATAALEMYVKMPNPGPGIAADKLEVKADGTVIGTITALDSAVYKAAYVLYTIPINSLANGASHTFRIEGFQSTTSVFNILVDDVKLKVNGGYVNLFEFETGENEIIIFPNPANEVVNLQFRNIEGDVNVVITDITGKVVSQETVYAAYAKAYTFGTESLESGNYVVTVSQDGNVLRTEKLVITK